MEKYIKGQDGDYTVSEDGTVYSYKSKNMRCVVSQFVKSGYICVMLWHLGKRKTHKVHRLVAEAFVHNPHPRKFKVVMHLDDDKLNPHKDNLKWGSQLLNMKDMCRKGRHRNQHIVKNKGTVS